MSTHCLTIFKDGDEEVATLYRHFDGYPEEHGLHLAECLAGKEIVAGHSGAAREFNGASDLAVRAICHLKMNVSETTRGKYDWPGNLYLVKEGEDLGQEYLYTVEATEGQPIRVTVDHLYPDGRPRLFRGTPEEMLEWISDVMAEKHA